MGRVQKGRFTADVSALGDEAVVFLIGMRINKPWKVGIWWPVFVAMPKMLNYLAKQPDKGLLGYEQAFFPSPIIRPLRISLRRITYLRTYRLSQ